MHLSPQPCGVGGEYRRRAGESHGAGSAAPASVPKRGGPSKLQHMPRASRRGRCQHEITGRRHRLLGQGVVAIVQRQRHVGPALLQRQREPLRIPRGRDGVIPTTRQQHPRVRQVRLRRRILARAEDTHGPQQHRMPQSLRPQIHHRRSDVRAIAIPHRDQRRRINPILLLCRIQPIRQRMRPRDHVGRIKHAFTQPPKKSRHRPLHHIPTHRQHIRPCIEHAPQFHQTVLIAARAVQQQQCALPRRRHCAGAIARDKQMMMCRQSHPSQMPAGSSRHTAHGPASYAACMAGQQRTLAFWQRTRRLALAYCLAAALLWLFTTLTLASLPLGTQWRITLTAGALVVQHSPHSRVHGASASLAWSPQRPRLAPLFSRAKAGMFSSVIVSTSLWLPLWPLPVSLVALAWYARTHIKRLQPHACPHCGYDTRGLAAGACCPECGTPCTV